MEYGRNTSDNEAYHQQSRVISGHDDEKSMILGLKNDGILGIEGHMTINVLFDDEHVCVFFTPLNGYIAFGTTNSR